jgi:hypothetical protein
MAIRYATKTGNWSDTTVWDGGTLPAATDDVYANNFIVTIDVPTLTVSSLKRIANTTPAIVAGGSYAITGSCALTITAGITAADNASGSLAMISITGSGNVTLSGGSIAGASSGGRYAIQVETAFTGTLTINNALTVVSVNTINALNTAGTIILNGNLTGAVGAILNCQGVGPIVTVNGAISAGTAGSPPIAMNAACINGQLTLNGTITDHPSTSAAVTVSAGSVRINCLVLCTTSFPITFGTSVKLVFGPNVGFRAAGDANWPLATGTPVTATLLANVPTSANVRAGVSFGAGIVGTLAVPPPASVAAGVPTDNTVGTAAVKLSDIAAVTGAQIAAATDT